MKTYKLEDIFKFVFDIENQGRKFYENAADSTHGKETKNLFFYLSKEEVKHAKIFLKFYNIYSKKKTFFPTDERFEDLLDTLVRGALFPDISELRNIITQDKRKNTVAIIKIAMGVELNTILFYRKIQDLVRQKEIKKALDKVIQEEEKHLVKLKNLRLDLDPLYAGLEYGKFF